MSSKCREGRPSAGRRDGGKSPRGPSWRSQDVNFSSTAERRTESSWARGPRGAARVPRPRDCGRLAGSPRTRRRTAAPARPRLALGGAARVSVNRRPRGGGSVCCRRRQEPASGRPAPRGPRRPLAASPAVGISPPSCLRPRPLRPPGPEPSTLPPQRPSRLLSARAAAAVGADRVAAGGSRGLPASLVLFSVTDRFRRAE